MITILNHENADLVGHLRLRLKVAEGAIHYRIAAFA
jgi:hypothetical protein